MVYGLIKGDLLSGWGWQWLNRQPWPKHFIVRAINTYINNATSRYINPLYNPSFSTYLLTGHGGRTFGGGDLWKCTHHVQFSKRAMRTSYPDRSNALCQWKEKKRWLVSISLLGGNKVVSVIQRVGLHPLHLRE